MGRERNSVARYPAEPRQFRYRVCQKRFSLSPVSASVVCTGPFPPSMLLTPTGVHRYTTSRVYSDVHVHFVAVLDRNMSTFTDAVNKHRNGEVDFERLEQKCLD